MDCHPKVTINQSNEPVFWDTNNLVRPLNFYNIPKAYDDEILMEKSPEYMEGRLGDLENRANNMKRTLPNLKFLVFLCHPVERILSWIKQLEFYNEEHKADRNLAYKELNLTDNKCDPISALQKIEFGLMSKTEKISNSSARISWRKQVELSFYDERIDAYFSELNSNQFHFVDGENIINRPWVEFEKIEEFLGI